MKKSILKSILGVFLIFISSCSPTLDATTEESLNETGKAIVESLNKEEKAKFLDALLNVLQSHCLNDRGHFDFNCLKENKNIDSLQKVLHGKNYKEVIAMGEVVNSKIEKLKLKHAYSKREKAKTYSKCENKLVFKIDSIVKNSRFNNQIDVYYYLENDLGTDVTSYGYKTFYISGEDTIANKGIMNMNIAEGEKSTGMIFFSGKEFETLDSVSLDDFSLEIISANNYHLPEDDEVLFDKMFFTQQDVELIEELEKKYPELRQNN
ncbi:MAG: hypothetical protein ACK4ND_08495 [Cytophagaceae bacterium]